MRLEAVYQKRTLQFKFEAGTSRGILTEKDSYFLKIYDERRPHLYGLGECSPLKGLSIDDRSDFEVYLNEICEAFPEIGSQLYAWDISAVVKELVGNEFPSIQFGVETALLDLLHGGRRTIFNNSFANGQRSIDINGLIWMGDKEFMLRQIQEKLREGYRCIKMKIGAIHFEQECELLRYIRQQYPARQITLRVDANGAFTPEEAPEKLRVLAQLGLHSIEQPIKPGQIATMAHLCRETPLPIALDEELIGRMERPEKLDLLKSIKPQYIILKPSLLGGFGHCREWIQLAEGLGIGWWITSALESNVGLNAISQFTAEFNNSLAQGLGTGQLYTNNIASPLEIKHGQLRYNITKPWGLQSIIDYQ
jgi:o-succinylbenzoate synthase